MKAPLIVKWRYWKNNSAANTKASSYLNYIGTRSGAEIPENGWETMKVTKKQSEIIRSLLKDSPGIEKSDEYLRFKSAETRGAASELISSAFENSPEIMSGKEYLGYIGTRPRAERVGATALFSDEGKSISLEEEKKKLDGFNGRVNSVIISLSREDAESTGFNCSERWMLSIRSHKQDLSRAFNIPLENLIWYGAFHNESYHPHIHLLLYSTDPEQEGYLTEESLMRLKSVLAAEIFKDELTPIYKAQTESRDELTRIAREEIAELIKSIRSNSTLSAELADKLLKLSDALKTVKGRKVYAFLPPHIKNIVNEVTDAISKDERIQKLYDRWYELKCEVVKKYTTHYPEKVSLSMEETFRPIKNAVIKAAIGINSEEINMSIDSAPVVTDSAGNKKFPGKKSVSSKQEEYQKRVARSYAASLLHSISGIFETACYKESEKLSDSIDSRLQREIEAKKMGEIIHY